jgi:SAM-dependent methyltransferase
VPDRVIAPKLPLEVGAGCGAVTRILGERCGLVDAVEPMWERARCARERNRDLDNVEVFRGTIDAVPRQDVYDVVVIIGVLEYVGRGAADVEPSLDFLATAASMLRPGGSLVLGIENRLGVKYMCGAPEDHSGRPFDSLEGYDHSSPARTFSRRDLQGFMERCGLFPTVLSLFPDYKMMRFVYSDRMLERAPHMVASVPHFPSPDWSGGPPRVANEARVWSTLVNSGLGADTANSFLVLGYKALGHKALGHKAPRPSGLWPAELLGAYYSDAGRRVEYASETRITWEAGTTRVMRRPLVEGASAGHMVMEDESSPLVPGDDLLWVMARTSDDQELAELLRSWLQAMDRTVDLGLQPAMDLLPHNALLDQAGDLSFVDAKWDFPGFDREGIIARAAYVTAVRLAGLTPPDRWPAITLGGAGPPRRRAARPPSVERVGGRRPGPRGAIPSGHSVVRPGDENRQGLARRLREDFSGQLTRPLAVISHPTVALDPTDSSHSIRHIRQLSAELGRAGAMLADSEQRFRDMHAQRDSLVSEWNESEERRTDAERRAARATEAAQSLQEELDRLTSTRTFRYRASLRSMFERVRRPGK